MIVNVWLIYKPGEPRIYTRTFQPDPDQVEAYRRDGFQLFRAQVYLPVDGATRRLDVTPATLELEPVVEPPIGVPLTNVWTAPLPKEPEPEQMKIYCPVCTTRHYDEHDPDTGINWATRPHRKHLCANCKHVWQEAEHNTIGV